MPEATAQPVSQTVKFLVAYANVYVHRRTGELEVGARVYRSPSAAEARRAGHPVRDDLAFVGVFPLSGAVPDQVRQATMAAHPVSTIDPALTNETEPEDGNEGNDEHHPEDDHE